MQNIKILSKVCLLIAVYYLVYYLYNAFLHPLPMDGDSWDYHIPIALSMLNDSFLHATFSTIPHLANPVTGRIHFLPQWYYPGSSEAINALFIFLHIPAFSNIFATLVLFFCLWKLGRTFRLSYYYALLFALTFCTLTVVLRWLNAVSIDIWMGVWFSLSVILLERPQKSLLYFAKLGFVLGMLIGSKYTALYFLFILLVFYGKQLFAASNLVRIITLLVPFSVCGLFWYIRNYLLIGNPFYPVPRFGFNGPLAFSDTVWDETLKHPVAMFNAGFSEYHLWLFSVIIACAVLMYSFIIKKQVYLTPLRKVFLLGVINFICYFSFPASSQSWIMVSSFRYSFPAFIPLLLGMFMLGAVYKKEMLLGYIAVANMIPVLTMAYYPKLLFFSLPVGLLLVYVLD